MGAGSGFLKGMRAQNVRHPIVPAINVNWVDIGAGLEDDRLAADRTCSRHYLGNSGLGHHSQVLGIDEHLYQDSFWR